MSAVIPGSMYAKLNPVAPVPKLAKRMSSMFGGPDAAPPWTRPTSAAPEKTLKRRRC